MEFAPALLTAGECSNYRFPNYCIHKLPVNKTLKEKPPQKSQFFFIKPECYNRSHKFYQEKQNVKECRLLKQLKRLRQGLPILRKITLRYPSSEKLYQCIYNLYIYKRRNNLKNYLEYPQSRKRQTAKPAIME